MVIDEVTKRNLELTQSLFEQGRERSLFWLLDETITLMGSRTLKQWFELSADRCPGDRKPAGGGFRIEREKDRKEATAGILGWNPGHRKIDLNGSSSDTPIARDLIGLKIPSEACPFSKGIFSLGCLDHQRVRIGNRGF